MHPLKSNRLAWSIAIASLALWATTAPVTWGAVASGTARLFDQSAEDDSASSATADAQSGDPTTVTSNDAAQSPQCPTIPPSIAQLIPPTPTSAPVPANQAGTFHLCGADPEAARAVEQLIAGRGFSASLTSRGDGCADLTIRVSLGTVNGSSSSNLSVSLGSGRSLAIQITSAQAATHASITEQ
jgi:hypothetical protein